MTAMLYKVDTMMISGNKSMGSHKHGTSGYSTKSPKFRHALKREAEKDIREDRSRLRDPKETVGELFHSKTT